MTDARIPVHQDLVMREVARERDELRAEANDMAQLLTAQAIVIRDLRAENADLLAQANRTAGIYEHCHCDADIIRDRDAENERLRAALEEVKSYGHWSDCPAGASDNYRCRCPYGDLSEALGRDTE